MVKRKFPKHNLSETELLECASAFTFFQTGALPDDDYLSYFSIRVESRGKGLYAVLKGGECWVGDKWDYESQPSSRTDAFLKKARFPLNEAIDIAKGLVDELRLNGSTLAEVREYEASSLAETERRDAEARQEKVPEPLEKDAFIKTIRQLHPSKRLLEDLEAIEATNSRKVE